MIYSVGNVQDYPKSIVSNYAEKGKAELLTTTEPNKGKNLQKMLLDEWHLLFETVPNKQTNGFEGKGC